MRLPYFIREHLRRLIGASLTLLCLYPFRPSGLAQTSSARLECDSISSAILGRAVEYCVALPPGYDAGVERYPVLYYLHGLFEDERSWSEHSGRQTWESLMSQGKIGKFIVVMPDGGKSFYVNSFDGHERYEDFFIQEFVPRSIASIAPLQAARPAESAASPWGAMARCTLPCGIRTFSAPPAPTARR